MVNERFILCDLPGMSAELKVMQSLANKPVAKEMEYEYAIESYYGHKASSEGDYATARYHYRKALQGLPVNNSTIRLRTTKLKDLALLELNDHHPDAALSILPQALELATKSRQTDLRLCIYQIYSMIYEATDNEEQKRLYKNKVLQLRDSISSFSIADNLGQLEFIRERRTLTNRLAILSVSQKIWFWSFVAALVVIGAITTLSLVLRRKNKALRRQAALIYRQLQEKYLQAPTESKVMPEDPDVSHDIAEKADLADVPEDNGLSADDTDNADSGAQIKYESSSLSEADKKAIAEKIEQVMQTDIIYSHDLSMKTFAQAVGRHPKAVSQVIHETRHCNFSSLINHARIVEVMRRMEMPEYAHLSTEAIADSVGFASRNTFGANFKKFTGLSLREYRSGRPRRQSLRRFRRIKARCASEGGRKGRLFHCKGVEAGAVVGRFVSAAYGVDVFDIFALCVLLCKLLRGKDNGVGALCAVDVVECHSQLTQTFGLLRIIAE